VRRNPTPAQKEGDFRFGSGGCTGPGIFPSKDLPVLDYSFYSFKRGARAAKLAGLQGFAVDAVDRIGVIGRDNTIVFTVPVEQNVYTAGRRGFPGARGIVALDQDGKVLWVQCTASSRGRCGRYKSSPGPAIAPEPVPKRPPEPRNPVRQSGTADGVTIRIRGSYIEADFSRISPSLRHVLVYRDGRVVFGCFKVVDVAGQANATGASATKPFAPVVRISPWNPYAHPQLQYAPFDGCTVSGNYGHAWGDAHGTHDAVEVPLTARGRWYLTERAVARDVAWLTHARIFTPIRYAQRPFTSASAASLLGEHALPLSSATGTPPVGKLGIWLGPDRRIVLAERTPTGRRLYVELRRGITYRTNLFSLAKPF